jgi:hypothetical protein
MTTKNLNTSPRALLLFLTAGMVRLGIAVAVLAAVSLLFMNAVVDALVYTITAALLLFWSSCSTPAQTTTHVKAPAKTHHSARVHSARSR